MTPSEDEFGIPIKKKKSADIVDEFDIPIKKKVSDVGGIGGSIGGTVGASKVQSEPTTKKIEYAPIKFNDKPIQDNTVKTNQLKQSEEKIAGNVDYLQNVRPKEIEAQAKKIKESKPSTEPAFDGIEFMKQDIINNGGGEGLKNLPTALESLNLYFDNDANNAAGYFQRRTKDIDEQIKDLNQHKSSLEQKRQLSNPVQGDISAGNKLGAVNPLTGKPTDYSTDEEKSVNTKINELKDYKNKLAEAQSTVAKKYAAWLTKDADVTEKGKVYNRVMGDENAAEQQRLEDKGIPISQEQKYNTDIKGLEVSVQELNDQYEGRPKDEAYYDKLAHLNLMEKGILNKYPEYKKQQGGNLIAQLAIKDKKLNTLAQSGSGTLDNEIKNYLTKTYGVKTNDLKGLEYGDIPSETMWGNIAKGVTDAGTSLITGATRIAGTALGVDEDRLTHVNEKISKLGSSVFGDNPYAKISESETLVNNDLKTIANPRSGKYNYNAETIKNAVGSGVGSLLGFIGGTKGVGKILSLTDDAAMTSYIIGSGFEPNYQKANEVMGKDASEVSKGLYAAGMGYLEALAFKVLPKDKIFMGSAETKAAQKELAKTLEGATIETINKGALESNFKKILKGIVGTTEETAKIGGAMSIAEMAKAASNVLLGKDEDAAKFLGEGVANVEHLVRDLPFSMGIPLGLMEIPKYIQHSNRTKQILFDAGDNPDTHIATIRQAEEKGIITPEQAEKKLEVVNTMKDIVQSLPETNPKTGERLTQKQQIDYAYNRIKEIATKTKGDGIKDAALAPFYKKEAQELVDERTAIVTGTEAEYRAMSDIYDRVKETGKHDKTLNAGTKTQGVQYLQEQALTAPNSFKNQTNRNTELVVDLIARNTKEEIKAEIKGWKDKINPDGTQTETEAIQKHIDLLEAALEKQKKPVVEEVPDTKLSQPVEGLDEQGIPIGENVPAPTEPVTKPTDVVGSEVDAREINVLSMLKESKILTPKEKQILYGQYKNGVMSESEIAKYTNVDVADIKDGNIDKWANVVLGKIKGKEIKAEEIEFEELPKEEMRDFEKARRNPKEVDGDFKNKPSLNEEAKITEDTKPTEESSIAAPPNGEVVPETAAGEEGKKGITHAAVAELRKIVELPEYEGKPRETHEQLITEAQETIKNNPKAINDVLVKMEKDGEVSNKENAIAAVYKATLDAAIEKAPTKELLADARRLAKALDVSGTKLGKALESRKLIAPEDNLTNFLLDKEAAQGTALTETQLKSEAAKYEELKAAKEALEVQLEKEREQHAKDIAELGLNKAKAKAKRESKKSNEDYKAERKSSIEAAREALKKLRTGESGTFARLPLANELAAIAPHVKDFVKSLVNEGVDKLDNIITAVHAEFKDVLEGLSTKNVLDIIAGQHDTKREQTRNEKANTVRLLEREAKLLKELERERANEEKAKTESKKTESNRRIDELKEKIKEVRRQNKNKEEDTEAPEDLTAGEIDYNVKRQKQLIEKAKKLTQDIRDKKYLEEKEVPPVFKKSRKTQLLEDKVIDLENKIRHERSKDEYNKRSKARRAFDKVMEILGIRRLVQSAVDISVPFRQGATLLSPRKIDVWLKGFQANLQSIFSPKKFERIMHEIRKDPEYHNMGKDGVVFNDLGSADPNLHNEDFRKSFIYKIPILSEPLKASNRSADAFLNVTRYEMYKKMRDVLEKKGLTRESDPLAFQHMANFVMSMTGRGKMNRIFEGENMSNVLGNTFYGARLMASRFNLLNPVTYLDPKVPRQAKIEAFKDLAAFTGTMLAVGTALAYGTGAKVSLDPDDPSFLQLRYGDKVYDISGGLATYVRTFLRMTKAVYTKATGTKYDGKKAIEFGGMSVVNFFRNKLSPNTSYVTDAVFGKRYGEDFDPWEIAQIYPMYTEDVITSWKEEGGLMSLATVLAPNILGIGYGNYASKGSIDANLEDLLERNMRSDEMNSEKIINHNQGGRPVTFKEFNEFADKRDIEIEKGITKMFNEGVPELNDKNEAVIVPYKDLTKEQVVKETNRIKAEATRKVKEEMFGKNDKDRTEKRADKKLKKLRKKYQSSY